MLQFTSLSSRIISHQKLIYQIYRYTTAPTIVFKNNIDKSVSTKAAPVVENGLIDDKPSKLVAAAFASLKSEDVVTKPKVQEPKAQSVSQNVRRGNATDEIIQKATTVAELLKVAENPVVSRRHALKIVSILAEWSSTNKCKLSDFETDHRFTKLCRILGRNTAKPQSSPSRTSGNDDLSMVLGVTGDDEAAKLIASITLPQMVKVLSTLAQKRRRSIPLLRSITHNITRSEQDVLNLKECADVLYSAAVLTYPEIPLLEKVAQDIMIKLPENVDKSAVVGSILTSIGFLRYRNTELLDLISEWVVKHNEICRPQDMFALFITLATVNYEPVNSDSLLKLIVPQLSCADATKSPLYWIDFVWSLLVLNMVDTQHIESVLTPDLINRLKDENNLSVATKLKLLNIQAAASTLIPNYKGPTINNDSDITTVTITRSREKQTLVAAMLDSLGNLLPSLRTNIDTGMGFILDGECLMDYNCNPLSLDTPPPDNSVKIAFIAYDYHDFCKGSWRITGMNELIRRLLEAKGYNLVTVPYLEFNPRDKLIKRVQYLEKHLKDVIKKNVK